MVPVAMAGSATEGTPLASRAIAAPLVIVGHTLGSKKPQRALQRF